MNTALLVFLGGGLGSLARYGAGRLVWHLSGAPAAGGFPWGTFTVNVLGCLALGALAGYAEQRAISDPARAFLSVGLLGGFTTYATFNQETLALWESRGAGAAGGYVLAMVAVCLAAGWCGGAAARRAFAAG
ncbi:MAG: fluoride efflux transporter CrcB [Planctomycetes bacterium]|nr:fluoride efflux transporter CrcB [Planctomycetota bacterium]